MDNQEPTNKEIVRKKVKQKLNGVLGEGDLQAIEGLFRRLLFKQATKLGCEHEWVKIFGEKSA